MLAVPTAGNADNLINLGIQQQQSGANALGKVFSDYLINQDTQLNKAQANTLNSIQSTLLSEINNPEALQARLTTGNVGTGFETLKPENQVKARQQLMDALTNAQKFADNQRTRDLEQKTRTQNELVGRLAYLADQGDPNAMIAARNLAEANYFTDPTKVLGDLYKVGESRKDREGNVALESLLLGAKAAAGKVDSVDAANAFMDSARSLLPPSKLAEAEKQLKLVLDDAPTATANTFGKKGADYATNVVAHQQNVDAVNNQRNFHNAYSSSFLKNTGLSSTTTISDPSASAELQKVLSGLSGDEKDRGEYILDAFLDLRKEYKDVPLDVFKDAAINTIKETSMFERDAGSKDKVKNYIKDWAKDPTNIKLLAEIKKINEEGKAILEQEKKVNESAQFLFTPTAKSKK
jgi:hypothetical protein